jgi:hypothetical protein
MDVPTSIKVSLFLIRNPGGETALVVSPYRGCAWYTLDIGYVADLACDFVICMIRLTSLVVHDRGRCKSQGCRLLGY